ncbi:HIT family protein [Microbacterium saperdae]
MPSTIHEPDSYECPFCRFQRGMVDEWNAPSDLVAVTDRAFARIAPKWWPGNPGAVLVIPRTHVENIYDLPADDGHAVWQLTQQVAVAIRSAYGCDGTSIRQHNEPAGDQDIWHLHVHVFPRYADDDLYRRHDQSRWVAAEEREPYALTLRRALGLPFAFERGGEDEEGPAQK